MPLLDKFSHLNCDGLKNQQEQNERNQKLITTGLVGNKTHTPST